MKPHRVGCTPAEPSSHPITSSTVPFLHSSSCCIFCGQSASILFLSLPVPHISYLLVSHQAVSGVLLTGIVTLMLPVARETRERAPGPDGAGKTIIHPHPHPPPPRPRWLPHLATSQQYRTPANWFHVGPHWAGIKVCKG